MSKVKYEKSNQKSKVNCEKSKAKSLKLNIKSKKSKVNCEKSNVKSMSKVEVESQKSKSLKFLKS